MKIGIVTAQFNSEVTIRLQEGALSLLRRHGLKDSQILSLNVPGAVEIPLIAQKLFEAGCDGVVAIGCVIRGDTTHYDSVCRMTESGCMDVMLRFGKPIAFGVLTTENEEQALDRAGGSEGNKGADAAAVLIDMIEKCRSLSR